MATKDYVTRSQNVGKKGKSKNNKRPLNGVRIFISVLMLTGFVYSLYYLSGLERSERDENNINPPSQTNIQESESNNLIAEKDQILEQISTTPLPELQEEEWEYIDSLPDFEVEVETTSPLESDRQFIMQCGSFRTHDRAEELKAKLAFQGLESRILKSDGTNGIWHRVVLGPYDRKRAAERDRHILRDADIRGCKIW